MRQSEYYTDYHRPLGVITSSTEYCWLQSETKFDYYEDDHKIAHSAKIIKHKDGAYGLIHLNDHFLFATEQQAIAKALKILEIPTTA
jgi:hypothetical protein